MFKKGDKVRCINDYDTHLVKKGIIYTVEDADEEYVYLEHIKIRDSGMNLNRFELVKQDNNVEKIAPKSFSITGKPHHLVAMEEDLKEMGYSNWSNDNKGYIREDAGICLNHYEWKEEDPQLCRYSDASRQIKFNLPEQYSEAITFCKQQLEIAKEYFKKEEEIKVGDYVICVRNLGDGKRVGSGWELGKIFKVEDIKKPYNTKDTIYFPTDGPGVYSEFTRKATKKEIENYNRVAILGYSCQIVGDNVKFGCVEVPKVLVRHLYTAHKQNPNFTNGLNAITAEQLEKLNDLINE